MFFLSHVELEAPLIADVGRAFAEACIGAFGGGDGAVCVHGDEAAGAGAVDLAFDEEGGEDAFPFEAHAGVGEEGVVGSIAVGEKGEELFMGGVFFKGGQFLFSGVHFGPGGV